MSRPTSLAAAAAAAAAASNQPDLLRPAVKGIALGFVGGIIAILALMALAPSVVQADEMGGAKTTRSPSGARR